MIFDRLEHLDRYINTHPRFAEAIPFLKRLISENAVDGRHEMPNCDAHGAVYANICAYHTDLLSENSKMEAHRRYIDIQIILEGEENMYLTGTQTGEPMGEYNAEKDVEFMTMPEIDTTTRLTVPAGSFAIFFAGEQHAPNHAVRDSARVRKIVGKVLQ